MKKAIYFNILNYTDENLSLLRDSFELITLSSPSKLNDKLLRDVSVIFAPLGYYFGADLFDNAPNLQAIASNTTGIPHIDDQAAQARSIAVFSLQKETGFLRTITPTAELTLGLIISLTRNIIPARRSVLENQWNRWVFGGDAMLSRMTLGIVGLGRLGSLVAGYAAALGMQIMYYDPNVAGDQMGVATKVDNLFHLLGHSDIVTVHADLNDSNSHIFDRDAFSACKRGSFFINTARGELVDSEALVWALEKGIIKGAAVDVLDQEFNPGFDKIIDSHPLTRYAKAHDNLLITPHIAGSTKDAWHETQRFVIMKTLEFLYPEKFENATTSTP